MYIVIGSTTYSKLANITFDPEADVTGSEVPVNQFTADIITTDDITTGSDIYLYDDLDQIWAKFWLTDAYRLDDNTVRVTAQSLLAILERITVYPTMYSSATVSDVIAEIFEKVSAIYGSTVIYEIDSSFSSETISGYMAEHSARYRLQLVLMVVGAYCKQVFTDHLQFLPVSNVTEFIPMSKIKWRPEIGVSDYVTAVKVRAFTYTQGTPTSTDEWVEVNEVYYIQTSQDFMLTNPDAPSTAPENVVEVDDVTIINTNNVSDILSRLSLYYFLRGKVSAEVINNGEYIPGQRVLIPVDDDTAYAGHINSASFKFGLQAVSRIKLRIKFAPAEAEKLEPITIICQYNDTDIKRISLSLPIDYEYTIENVYIELQSETNHSVLYPITPQVTGTVPEGGETVYVQYALAINEYFPMGLLMIYSADEVTRSTETEDETSVEVLTIG